MDAALDIWTRKLVSASTARGIPFGSFVCPICLDAVHLRDGPKRVAHFAHNVARQDCELSFLSMYRAGAQHIAHVDQDRRIGDFLLGLRLYVTGRPMTWGLELDLGVKDISEGQVLIDVGGRETTADLTNNRLSSYTVVVEPQQAPYQVMSVSPPHSQAAIFEGGTCEGLRSTGMTAFTAVGRAGHALFYRAEKIEGGRTYVVVWRDDILAQIPADFECESLDARNGFSAALVIIPKVLSQNGVDWVKSNLNLPAENKIQHIVQVWPPITCRITSQSVQSVRDETIFVAFDEADARQKTSAFVRCDGDVQGAESIPGARTYFRYDSTGKSAARFLTTDGSGAMLDVEFSLPNTTPWRALNTTVVVGITTDEGLSGSSPLHSRLAQKALLDVRCGHATLDYLSMPRAAQGRVHVGLGDAAVEHCIRATSEGVVGQKQGFRPSEEEFALLVAAVCDPDLTVVLDFGTLGYVSLPAIRRVTMGKAEREPAQLPDEIRTLLRSYLFRHVSIAVWPRPDIRMTDAELVKLFYLDRRMRDGAALRRYLERELARYVDGVTP